MKPVYTLHPMVNQLSGSSAKSVAPKPQNSSKNPMLRIIKNYKDC